MVSVRRIVDWLERARQCSLVTFSWSLATNTGKLKPPFTLRRLQTSRPILLLVDDDGSRLGALDLGRVAMMESLKMQRNSSLEKSHLHSLPYSPGAQHRPVRPCVVNMLIWYNHTGIIIC